MPKVRVFEIKVEQVKKAFPLGQKWRVRVVGLNNETIAVGETLSNKGDAQSVAELIAFGSGTIT